jgi:hypothetical protein
MLSRGFLHEGGLPVKSTLFLILMIPAMLLAQENTDPDPWAMLRAFEGAWTGQVAGKAGTGVGEREYRFVLQDTYLYCTNKATFAPQEKNPEGEVHEDWGIFSYDKGRKTFVLRQFHVEGYVNRYALDTLESNDSTLVFITEAIENIPDGWRAKITLTMKNHNQFTEAFQLAPPGKDFGTCIENSWKRRK